jgi:hypothetical protein
MSESKWPPKIWLGSGYVDPDENGVVTPIRYLSMMEHEALLLEAVEKAVKELKRQLNDETWDD